MNGCKRGTPIYGKPIWDSMGAHQWPFVSSEFGTRNELMNHSMGLGYLVDEYRRYRVLDCPLDSSLFQGYGIPAVRYFSWIDTWCQTCRITICKRFPMSSYVYMIYINIYIYTHFIYTHICQMFNIFGYMFIQCEKPNAISLPFGNRRTLRNGDDSGMIYGVGFTTVCQS